MNTPTPPASWEDSFFDEEEVAEHEDYQGLLPERKGEVIVTASLDGRALTLDPIRSKVIDVPWREVESVIPCGFQIPWIDGDADGEPFQLNCGAGSGSRWMTFHYKGHRYCISSADIIENLVEWANEAEQKG